MPTRTEITADKAAREIVALSIALSSGLAFGIVVLFMCVAPLTGKIAGARDFVIYWATGQQLIHHANPYDLSAMAQIEHAAGLPAKNSMGFMRNPPWGLLITLPLGLVGLRLGTFLWSLLLLACLWGSVHMLWVLHGRPRNSLHWLALSFAPAVSCLIAGQTGLFALLGLVLFLRLHRSRPFLAGMALWLCALKPHLFLVFGVVLLAWILVEGCFRILAGAATALAASCAAVYCIDPTAWSDYLHMMSASGIQREPIPCLGIMLRLWLSPQTTWLQYLPALLGCVWALSYYWPRRHSWDWLKNGSLVMLVSIVFTPFGWIFDQVLAIPALLQGAYLTRSKTLLAVLALASIVVTTDSFWGVDFFSTFNLWIAPAWLAWYLLASASPAGPRVDQQPS